MLAGPRPYLALLALTLIAAGGSIYYLTHLATASGGPAAVEYPAVRATMSGEYATLARNMVDHGVFSLATSAPYTPDAWRTPGYPALIAPFYVLFDSFYPVLFLQVLVLFATAALLYRMAQRFMPSSWAFCAAALYVLLPGTLLAASMLLTENVFVFCFLLALYLCFFAQSGRLYLRFALAGLLLAASVYIRPASLYILPFFLFGYFAFYVKWPVTRRQVIAGLLLAVVFLAALAPWCYRNYQRFGHFAFASTGAFVLFRQNATQFYENYHDIPNIEARYILLERAGLPPGPVPGDFENSKALKDVAVDVITEHPVAYAVFHLTSFIPFFTSSGAQNYWFFAQTLLPDFDPEPEPSLIQALHPFHLPTLLVVLKNHGWTLLENAFWAGITLLMLIGLAYSRNRRLAWMFFTLMIYFALVTGPIAHARYRMAVEPLMLLVAFSAAASLWYGRDEIKLALASRLRKLRR